MALEIKVSNNATGSLNAGISDSATSLSLKVGEGDDFPALSGGAYFYATLQKSSGAWEIVKVTARSGDNFTTIVRNIDSSTGSAQAFSADDIVALRPVQQIIEDLITQINANIDDLIPAGTKMYFYEDTAPSGWTLDSGVADVLLAVKGGSNAYDTTGGTIAGTWVTPNHDHGLNSHTHTGPAHVHATTGHILTITEMPAHAHGGGVHSHIERHASGTGALTDGIQGGNDGFGNVHDSTVSTKNSDTIISTQGGGAAHSHGDTGSAGTGNTGAATGNTEGGATASSHRPYGGVGIIATKD